MTLKVAVIGVGSMGKNHTRIYWGMPGVELVGVADPNEVVVNQIATRYCTQGYTDYRKMLDEQHPDAVTIAVPTRLHKEVSMEVMQRGIHCLLEKPIAMTVEDGQEILEFASQIGVKLMVGHIERFNPAVISLKQHLTNGELGRVFELCAYRQGPFPARISDVGVVIDLAVHDLDIIRYVTNSEIIRVYAETERRIHSKHEDLLSGIIRLNDGSVGVLNINWLTPTKLRELYVTGECGMFHVDYLTQDLFFYENISAHGGDWEMLHILRGVGEGKMVRYVVEKKEPLLAEQEAFLSAIENNTPIPVSGLDGLRALELAKALVLSGHDHQVIETATSMIV